MTVEFSEQAEHRPAAIDDGRDRVVTFRTTRGEFSIEPELFEEGREGELAQLFAKSLPLGVSSTSRRRLSDGTVVIRWRLVRVVELQR